MELGEALEILAVADARPTPWRVARCLLPRQPGGSRPWDALADDGRWYVVKCLGNAQDRRAGPPCKVLPTELAVARLGRLWAPPVCPEPAVVEVPPEVAQASWHPPTRRRAGERARPGPAFGSLRLEDVWEPKARTPGPPRPVAAGDLARVLVFQAWLRAVDATVLLGAEGRVWSVDHGYYLTGPTWDLVRLAVRPVRLRLPQGLHPPEALRDPRWFAPALEELAALREADVVAAFGAMPEAWSVPRRLRAEVACLVLARRPEVPRAVAAFCRALARRPGPRQEGTPG